MPVMGAAACFHADLAGLELGEKLQHALTPELLAQYQLAAPIDSVQIEHQLCDIHSDPCNLHDGPSRSSFSMVPYHRWLYEAVGTRAGSIPSFRAEAAGAEESRVPLALRINRQVGYEVAVRQRSLNVTHHSSPRVANHWALIAAGIPRLRSE